MWFTDVKGNAKEIDKRIENVGLWEAGIWVAREGAGLLFVSVSLLELSGSLCRYIALIKIIIERRRKIVLKEKAHTRIHDKTCLPKLLTNNYRG